MKRVHKTINTIQILHNDIVGLFYDIKELVTTYRGNLIALCVGIAVAVFNYNRPNAGMFFKFLKRSTVKYNSETIYDLTAFEEITVGISPTNSTFEGIFRIFCFYRCDEISKRSTISLGVVAALLLVCCMMACFCCLKKRGEVYILRNPCTPPKLR